MPRLLLLVPTATYRAGAFVSAAQKLGVDITIASERPSSLSRFHPSDLITLRLTEPARCAEQIADFIGENLNPFPMG